MTRGSGHTDLSRSDIAVLEAAQDECELFVAARHVEAMSGLRLVCRCISVWVLRNNLRC